MLQHRYRFIFFVWLIPQVCLAALVDIDPQAEAKYQGALVYLKEADRNLEALVLKPLGEEMKAKNRALITEAGTQWKIAMPLLEQAAALEHPVAQYRLALIYMMAYPIEQSSEKACPLLKKSLERGFPPAAVAISVQCYTYSDTPAYQAALQSITDNPLNYQSYFPEPALMLPCRGSEPETGGFQWGTAQDYQAEVYRLMGAKIRARRGEYFQKAMDINGCEKAKR